MAALLNQHVHVMYAHVHLCVICVIQLSCICMPPALFTACMYSLLKYNALCIYMHRVSVVHVLSGVYIYCVVGV